MTAILWMLLGVLFFLLLVAVSVVTVGLVYLVFPHFYKLWSVAIGMLTSQVTEGLMRITEWLYTYAPFVSLALLCASVLFHVLDRRRGHAAKIVLASVLAVLCLLFCLVVHLELITFTWG